MGVEEKKIKHLEFIQSNIARMNQCSFQTKSWMISIVSAMLALYAASVSPENGSGNSMFLCIAIVPTILFWFLDSYYLQQERRFRKIYNDLIEIPNNAEIKEFEMPIERYVGGKYCLLSAMISISEAPLYIAIIVGLLLAFLFL